MRRIDVVTTSRADYGHLAWTIHELRDAPDVNLRVIAIGAHLAPSFGTTVEAIEADGLRVDERVECLLDSDSDVGMAKSLGLATISLADVFARDRPDILLLIADRYEMLAPASAALTLRIPIAHIEGGDISEGAIDNAVRNALTMMSHLHFTPTETARKRIVAMGEEEWRVHRVGAASLDNLARAEIPSRDTVERELGVELSDNLLVVAMHPVTLAEDPVRDARELLAALRHVPNQIVFCFPNADVGSREIAQLAGAFCAERQNATLHVNLAHLTYWGLLSSASVMVGNSSSGIMETPALGLPTVNIGDRQRGRERARNIVDVPADARSIQAAVALALDPAFRAECRGVENPYGDGDSARRIATRLRTLPINDRLLLKRTTLQAEMLTLADSGRE